MAKKKSAAKPNNGVADKASSQTPPAKPKSGVVKKPATPTTAKAAAAGNNKVAALSTEEIGHAAGVVWQVLEGSESLTITALKKATGLSGDLAVAGLGWLAREDKLHFDASGRSVKVGLR